MRYCLRFWSGGLATAVFFFISLSARAGGDGLGDNADVIDAGYAKCVNHVGKTAKRNGFVAAEPDAWLTVGFQLRTNARSELMEIMRLTVDVDARGVYH